MTIYFIRLVASADQALSCYFKMMEEQRKPSIFVANLQQDLPKQVIRQVFAQYGTDEG